MDDANKRLMTGNPNHGLIVYSFANQCVNLHFANAGNEIRERMTEYQELESIEVQEAVETTDVMELVVFNDDFNTFDHVIETLIRVCKHTIEQAEQCTWIIHFRGKCAVKSGTYDFLQPMRNAICEAGIEARIL